MFNSDVDGRRQFSEFVGALRGEEEEKRIRAAQRVLEFLQQHFTDLHGDLSMRLLHEAFAALGACVASRAPSRVSRPR